MELSEYDLPALKGAAEHLVSIEQTVSENALKMPGPGWDVVFDILKLERDRLTAEVARRVAAGLL